MPFLIMTHLSLCPYNLIVLYSDERSEGEYKFNYFYWVRSFGFGDVHFIVRLCHVTIALVFKLVTWILKRNFSLRKSPSKFKSIQFEASRTRYNCL